ncbi:unnamed protein product [Sympodiomycopsis kandeliae]
MQFSSVFVAVAAVALTASTASAKVIRGFSVPTQITKGKEFNLTFKTQGALSGPKYFWAQYGILAGRNDTDQLGTLINGTDLFALGKTNVVEGDFSVPLTIPKDGVYEDISGEALFGLALYGVGGALNHPTYSQYNQTVTIS